MCMCFNCQILARCADAIDLTGKNSGAPTAAATTPTDEKGKKKMNHFDSDLFRHRVPFILTILVVAVYCSQSVLLALLQVCVT